MGDMKHWDEETSVKVENSKVDDFIEEVIEVCKKHGLSISHEDGHGAFVIEPLLEENFTWLREAILGRAMAQHT